MVEREASGWQVRALGEAIAHGPWGVSLFEGREKGEEREAGSTAHKITGHRGVSE
jgi:hypothetical protein